MSGGLTTCFYQYQSLTIQGVCTIEEPLNNETAAAAAAAIVLADVARCDLSH